jgi:hypothetical protein
MPIFRRLPVLLTLLALGLLAALLRAEGLAEDAPAPRTQWVQGRVQSLGSPDAVAGATVEDLSSHRLTVTAQDGSFRLEMDSAPNTPAVRAYADGFAPLTRRWPKGLPTLLKLGLKPNVMNGGEITITGQRDHPEPSHQAIKAKELAKVAGANNDPLKALETLPGVVVVSDFSDQMAVRGGDPQDNSYLLDHCPWPSPFHLGGFESTISADLMDQIDFYPSSFPARFGDGADGAVIDVSTRPGKDDRIHGKLDINFLGASGMAEGPTGFMNGSWAVQGRRSYFDLAEKLADFGGVNIAYWDLGATLVLHPAPGHTLKALVLTSVDQLEMDIKADKVNDPRFAGAFNYLNGFGTGGITWDWDLAPETRSELSLYATEQDSSFKLGTAIDSVQQPSTEGLREDFRWHLGRLVGVEHSLDMGAEGLLRQETDTFSVPQDLINKNIKYNSVTLTEDTSADDAAGAAWLEDRLRVAPAFLLLVSARAEKFSNVSASVLMPRLGAEWDLDEVTTLKAAWGVYAHQPNVMQSDPVLGNPNLSPAITQDSTLGLERRLGPGLTGRVEAYYKVLGQVIESDTTTGQVSNDGEGEAYGLELFLRQQMTGKLSGWLDYTYSRSIRLPSASLPWQYDEFDEPHVFNLVLNYQKTPQWSMGTKLRYNSGPRVTPILSTYQDQNLVWQEVKGQPYSQELGDTLRWDVRTDYSFLYWGWKLDVYLEIINLLGRENPQGLSDQQGDVQVTKGFPRFPMLGVSAEF